MRVIGAMSGSSLDGIDVACCTFERTPTGWKGRVEAARTVPFTAELRDRLESASSTTGLELAADINIKATLRLQGSYTVLDTKARRYLDPAADAAGVAMEGAAPSTARPAASAAESR